MEEYYQGDSLAHVPEVDSAYQLQAQAQSVGQVSNLPTDNQDNN